MTRFILKECFGDNYAEPRELSIGESYSGPSRQMLYGEFEPPLRIRNGLISQMFFKEVTLSDGFISVQVGNTYSLSIPRQLESLTLSIKDPKPLPQPALLNGEKHEDKTYFSLFFQTSEEEMMEIGSLTVKHQDFKAELERLLSRLGYPVASIAAAIPDETVPLWPEDFVFLEALPSLQRFKEQAKEALPLVIKSYSSAAIKYEDKIVTTSGLPFWPKLIAESVIKQNPHNPSWEAACLRRRLLASAINSGIDLSYLDEVKIPYGKERNFLSASNFPRIQLKFRLSNLDWAEIAFQKIIQGYNRFIKFRPQGLTFNEATLTTLIWDPMVRESLLSLTNEFDCYLLREWSIKELFPQFKMRKIDSVIVVAFDEIRIGDKDLPACIIPILLIESGKDQLRVGEEHKDIAKLHGAMSAINTRFAFELSQRGKDPALARTFGLLISGSKAELSVAHVVSNLLGTDKKGVSTYNFHAIVSKSPHWTVDLFTKPHRFCLKGCCFARGNNFTKVCPATQPIDAPTQLNTTTTGLNFNFERPNLGQGEVRVDLSGAIEMSALARFEVIIAGIVETARMIQESADVDLVNRRYLPPKDDGFVVKGRPSGSAITPAGERPVTSTVILRDDPDIRLRIASMHEAKLLKYLSLHWPNFFPRILDANDFSNCTQQLKMEKLPSDWVKIILHNSYNYSPVVVGRAAKLLLDVLASLLILHRQGFTLNGRLKKEQIGYSWSDLSWKMMGFGARRLNPQGAAAAELFFDELHSVVYDYVFLGDDDEYENSQAELLSIKAAEKGFLAIQQLIIKMKEPGPDARISVTQALESIHKIAIEMDLEAGYYRDTSTAFTIECLLYGAEN